MNARSTFLPKSIRIYNLEIRRGSVLSEKQSTAIMWIRDGVLVNRMHVNPVAFAFAYWMFTAPENRTRFSIETLINFGFTKSGFSCADKMFLFNQEHEGALENMEAAADYYNVIATKAANSCTYFDGIPELLADLKAAGAKSFITSAVEQKVLNDWAADTQGRAVSNTIEEILGKRENFLKGPDHFEYVERNIGAERIYYVADALSEIIIARANQDKYNLVPIGFSYFIRPEQVMDAVALVSDAVAADVAAQVPYAEIIPVNPALLQLPDEWQLAEQLRTAGAQHVVSGEAQEIVGNLRKYFETCGLLAPVSQIV